jgi:hypothetical protein
MSDLRESGSLEQDADMVILLHRDDVYEKESTRPGEADLIVAKHRNGPTRDTTVAFQGHYSRFVDMAHPIPVSVNIEIGEGPTCDLIEVTRPEATGIADGRGKTASGVANVLHRVYRGEWSALLLLNCHS